MVGITIATPDIATSEANNILKNELLLGNQENSLQHDIKSQMTVQHFKLLVMSYKQFSH